MDAGMNNVCQAINLGCYEKTWSSWKCVVIRNYQILVQAQSDIENSTPMN